MTLRFVLMVGFLLGALASGAQAGNNRGLQTQMLDPATATPLQRQWLEAAEAKGGVDLEVLTVFLGNTGDPDTTDVIDDPVLDGAYFLYMVYRVETTYQVTHRVRLFIDGGLFDEGDFSNNSGTFVVWTATAGDHEYAGVVDALGQIAESDENNNALSLFFTVEESGGICQTDKNAPWNKGDTPGPIDPDEYENDDTRQRASTITVGEVHDVFTKIHLDFPQLHNFHDNGDLDWVKFHVVLDDDENMPVHRIRAQDPDFRADVVMEMFDAAGNPVTNFGVDGVVDDAGPGEEEEVEWTPVESATYYMCSRQADPAVSGSGTEYKTVVALFAAGDAGQIMGLVRDASTGDPIDQALLQTDPGSSYRWSTVDGSYALINLTEDAYDVVIDAIGYEQQDFNSIPVNPGEATPLDVFLTPSQKTAYAITQAASGSWYDTTHNGEGWLLEVLTLPTAGKNGEKGTPGIAVAYWFTYPSVESLAKGVVASQAWFVGVGEIVGDTIHFKNATNPEGGRFGAGFNPAQVQQPIWGDFMFRFDGCDTGTMSYVGSPAWGTGALNLERITRVAGLNCAARARNSKVTEISAGISGSWFDPSHTGEGWLIEVLSEDLALVYWFSYDTNGNPAWWVGVGTIDGKSITVGAAALFSGGVFGPDFNPNTVSDSPWGQMVFTFSSCNQGTMSYQSSIGEYGNGALSLQRITSVAGANCN